MSKVISADAAARLIRNGDVVSVSSSSGLGCPDIGLGNADLGLGGFYRFHRRLNSFDGHRRI